MRHGAAGSGGAAASAPAADVLSCVQGIAHSDVVVSQLKGQLLGFTGSLKSILKTRSESIKAQVDRRQQFGGVRDLGRPLSAAATGVGAPAGAAASSPASSALVARGTGGAAAGHRGLAAVPPGGHDDAVIRVGAAAGDDGAGASSAAAAFGLVTQAQLMPETALLESRASDVAVLERHITELSSMFSRLASVVMEQGSLVDRIEDNLETSLANVGAGTAQLTRYWERVSSNRTLIMKVFAVLVLFFILFAVFA